MSGATEENSGVNAAVTVEGNTATVDPEAHAQAVADAQAEKKADTLLAGKFKTPEDLVKAYKELESKLGQQGQQETQENPAEAVDAGTEEASEEQGEEQTDDVETTYGKVVGDAIKAAEIDVAAAQAEFAKDGKLSDENMKKFDDAGFPPEVVTAYLNGISAPAEQAKELAQTQVDMIKTSVGGPEAMTKVQDYVAKNYSEAELTEYNEAVASGNFEKALAAVTVANQKLAAAFGKEPSLLGGRTPATPGFADEAEFKAAIQDPRYKTSPAYRAQVEQKLMASPNIHITR